VAYDEGRTMETQVINTLQELIHNPKWITFLISMLPIAELRGAIPWGITYGELPWTTAVIYSIAGNFLITIPILKILGPLTNWSRQYSILDHFFNWLFARTRRKGKLIESLEFWGLIIFVGIPLPVTGAWTGAAAAYVFGLPFYRSLLAIFLGILMSATIVTIITLTGKFLFFHFI
jgi:uncharacterized membrane protein